MRLGHGARHLSAVPSLRPYQEECIDKCINKFMREGVRRQAVSLPVGSGKTVGLAMQWLELYVKGDF